MFKRLLLAVGLGLLLAAPVRAVDLRVAVVQDVGALTVGSSSDAAVIDESGQTIGHLPAMQPLTVTASGNQVRAVNVQAGRLRIVPDKPDGLVFIGSRWFRGAAEVYASANRATGLNLVDLEAYLYGVVGAEMIASWPEEALKAQAIAARTFALYNWTRRQNEAFDLGDTVMWQVYKGAEDETDSVRRAVDATAAQVLTFKGSLINAMYHNNAGGRTEDFRAASGSEEAPYLSSVEDYDQNSPYWKWQQVIPVATLRRSLGLIAIGDLLQVKIAERSLSGRALSGLFVGKSGSQLVKGTDVRFKLGLRSNFFEINPSGAPLNALTFDGHGFGHGIGMSQWGARALAALGWNCSRILKHYYQGVEVQKEVF